MLIKYRTGNEGFKLIDVEYNKNSRDIEPAMICPNCRQNFFKLIYDLDLCNPGDIDSDENYRDQFVEIICECSARVRIWFDPDQEPAWQQEIISYNDPNQIKLLGENYESGENH